MVVFRALCINEILTVVLESMLHDLATDAKLLAPLQRNRQMLGAFAATLLGALLQVFISISTGRMQDTLWLVGTLRLGIAGA